MKAIVLLAAVAARAAEVAAAVSPAPVPLWMKVLGALGAAAFFWKLVQGNVPKFLAWLTPLAYQPAGMIYELLADRWQRAVCRAEIGQCGELSVTFQPVGHLSEAQPGSLDAYPSLLTSPCTPKPRRVRRISSSSEVSSRRAISLTTLK